MCSTYPRIANRYTASRFTAGIQVCFVVRKSKHFNLISRLYLGLREHPTTEQHGPSFNTDIFNGEIQYRNLTVHKAPAVVLNVLDN